MLLEGTNITFRLTSARTAVLTLPSLSESVSVQGEIPSAPTVASPKYTAPLRDIPQTIEVIPRAAMEAQGVTTLSEALRNVPGHHAAGRRRRRRLEHRRRHVQHARLQRLEQPLRRQRARRRAGVAGTSSTSSRSKCSWGRPARTSAAARRPATSTCRRRRRTCRASNSATLTFGTANQRRGTFDVNQPLSTGNADSWIGKSAVRLNALWQDSGVAGRDEVENETKAFAPSIGLGLGTATRVIASAQILRQDNLPDYGIPGAAWQESTAGADDGARRRIRSIRATTTAARPSTTTTPTRTPSRRASSTTSTPRWTVSNQTRYNKTEREAVISTVQIGRVVQCRRPSW